MKVVGIMLTSALLILPAVTALQIAKSFKNTMILSSIIRSIIGDCRNLCILSPGSSDRSNDCYGEFHLFYNGLLIPEYPAEKKTLNKFLSCTIDKKS